MDLAELLISPLDLLFRFYLANFLQKFVDTLNLQIDCDMLAFRFIDLPQVELSILHACTIFFHSS